MKELVVNGQVLAVYEIEQKAHYKVLFLSIRVKDFPYGKGFVEDAITQMLEIIEYGNFDSFGYLNEAGKD